MKTHTRFKLIMGLIFVSLIIPCGGTLLAKDIIVDHFDDGVLDPAWEVNYENAYRYFDGGEAGSEFTVTNIYPDGSGKWGLVKLTREFDGLNDFDVEFSFSWDSDHPSDDFGQEVNAMMNVQIRLLDKDNKFIAIAGYNDPWESSRGQKVAWVEGNYKQSGANTLPFSGNAEVRITRKDGKIEVSWDGELFHSGGEDSPLTRIEIIFGYAKNEGPSSFFGTGAVDFVRLSQSTASEPALPLPTGQVVFDTFEPIPLALSSFDPREAKPIGVGSVSSAGDSLTLRIRINHFSGPVDIYFALYSTAIDPSEIFFFTHDGSVRRFSSSGFIPYKTNFIGDLDEYPLGLTPINVSLLPEGVYYFYLLAAPTGTLDYFYLWSTYFVSNAGNGNVPDGSVSFIDGNVVAPNATIIYRGNEHRGTAAADEDALIGIIRDDKDYLYHPGLGTAEINEETTRRAVGYFLLGPVVDSREIASLAAEAPNDSTKILKPGQEMTLDTGVTLHRLAAKVVKARNDHRRWAAVKCSDGSGSYLLSPKGRWVDSNEIRWILTGVTDYLEIRPDWAPFISNNVNVTTFDTSDTLTVETYGAVWRFYPYIANITGNSIKDIIDLIYHGQALPPNTVLPITALEKRNQKDPNLSKVLDQVDLAYMVGEGIKHLISAEPTEKGDLIANAAVNVVQFLHFSCWYASEGLGGQQALDNLQRLIEDLVTDFGNVAGATISFRAKCVLTFIDVLALLDWYVEGVLLHDDVVAYKSAYDEAFLPQEEKPKYYIRMWNIDDIGYAYVNDMENSIHSVGYKKDSGKIDISKYLKAGENIIRFKLWNGSLGGWTYGFEIYKDDETTPTWEVHCGEPHVNPCGLEPHNEFVFQAEYALWY